MNGEQQALCRILEESTDVQDDIPWYNREWNQMKLNAYLAACIALQYQINHKDREMLARILRCFCDSESGGVQFDLVRACEAYSDNPYEDEMFVSEVVKAAPEMLKKSPWCFGSGMFICLLYSQHIKWTYFIQTFKTLNRDEQQVIVDYLTYREEDENDEEEKEDYQILLVDCLKASGIEKGDSQFFREYFIARQ